MEGESFLRFFLLRVLYLSIARDTSVETSRAYGGGTTGEGGRGAISSKDTRDKNPQDSNRSFLRRESITRQNLDNCRIHSCLELIPCCLSSRGRSRVSDEPIETPFGNVYVRWNCDRAVSRVCGVGQRFLSPRSLYLAVRSSAVGYRIAVELSRCAAPRRAGSSFRQKRSGG